MNIKFEYETKDEVPSELVKFYTETDGKFTLAVEGAKSESDVKGLKESLDKERKAKREAEAKLREANTKLDSFPSDFDADEYHALLDNKGKGDKTLEEKLAEQRERLTRLHAEEKAKLEQEKSDLLSENKNKTINEVLSKSILENNIAKQFEPAVRALFKDKIKIEGTGDSVEVLLDDKPANEAFKEWAQSENGKFYVSADNNSGGGSGGNQNTGGANEKWSEMTETEQSALYQSNTEQARQMMQAEKQT